MPKTDQKQKTGTVVTLTFSEDQPYYSAPDVALFINELSRLYITTVRALREKKIEYRDNRLSVTKALSYSEILVSEIREHIQTSRDERLKRSVEINSHPFMSKDYYDFIRRVEKAQRSFSSTRPDWSPYFGENSDVLRIANINYNSPFKIGLTGWLLPVVLTIMLCGGSFQGFGFKIETIGLVDTAIKIRKEIFPNYTNKELTEMIKETNPDSPILTDFQRLKDNGMLSNDDEPQH